jgi:hypothetical protein
MFFKGSYVVAVESYGNIYKGAVGRIEGFSFDNGVRMLEVDLEGFSSDCKAPESCFKLRG